MKKLVFATHNPDKLKEINQMMPSGFQLLSLEDIGCGGKIPETADTLEGNARIKAAHVWENYGYDCFADDTGLEVTALQGAPGVYSARYAGPGANASSNMKKLLTELQTHKDRSGRFRTVIALVINGQFHFFQGVAQGDIICEPKGSGGFGYDPIFLPAGFKKTFAELPLEVKNQISHRGIAFKKLSAYLHKMKGQ
ncbi:MAG: non-canonical purine NTP diphosphatase [Robiginitalea sp.]